MSNLQFLLSDFLVFDSPPFRPLTWPQLQQAMALLWLVTHSFLRWANHFFCALLLLCVIYRKVYILKQCNQILICLLCVLQTFGNKNMKRVGVILQMSSLILLLFCLPCWALLINSHNLLLILRQEEEVARYIPSLWNRYINTLHTCVSSAYIVCVRVCGNADALLKTHCYLGCLRKKTRPISLSLLPWLLFLSAVLKTSIVSVSCIIPC